MHRPVRILGFVLAGVLATAAAPSRVDAVNIDVFPGAGTLQAAITAAVPGSRLLVHPGLYTGAVVVTKALKIECTHDATNDGGCIIDAECGAPVALDVAADGVSLKRSKKKILGAGGGPFLIRRGIDVGIRVAGRKKVKITELQVSGDVLCGTEQVGFDLSGALTGVKLDYVASYVGSVAKFRIANVPAGSKLLIDRSQSTAYPNEPAFLFQNSGAGASLRKAGIVVRRAILSVSGANAIGARFVDTDGVRFEKNYIVPSLDPQTPITGIALDTTSDNNYFFKNQWNDSELDETAFSDAGTGNCGKTNIGFTTPTCP